MEQERPHFTIWRMDIACWIHKATNTHSEYVILIVFSLQQRLHERPHSFFIRTLPVSIHLAAQNSLIEQDPYSRLVPLRLVFRYPGILLFPTAPHNRYLYSSSWKQIQFAKLIWKHSSELACIFIRHFWMFWAGFLS